MFHCPLSRLALHLRHPRSHRIVTFARHSSPFVFPLSLRTYCPPHVDPLSFFLVTLSRPGLDWLVAVARELGPTGGRAIPVVLSAFPQVRVPLVYQRASRPPASVELYLTEGATKATLHRIALSLSSTLTSPSACRSSALQRASSGSASTATGRASTSKVRLRVLDPLRRRRADRHHRRSLVVVARREPVLRTPSPRASR